jgi:hypothetical protein
LSFAQVLAPFFVGAGLPFAEVLSAEEVAQAVAEEGVSFGQSVDAVYTPAVTLWAFLSQVLQADKTCALAVRRVSAWRVAQRLTPCSEDTSAYCRARGQLPLGLPRRLTRAVSGNLERTLPHPWLWHGRHVQLVDGTTVTAPDTSAKQQAYPQSASQQPGLGFPLIRLVVLLSLASAALLDMAAGPCAGKETGETALLRQLLDNVPAGDVLLADRYSCNYWLVALAQAREVDVVFRMHQLRDYDFRRGERLGHDDQVAVWYKPQRPAWMEAELYADLPDILIVRELRYQVTTPGFRVRPLVLATTLTCAHTYTKEDLADLYHQRWHVEIDQAGCRSSGRLYLGGIAA